MPHRGGTHVIPAGEVHAQWRGKQSAFSWPPVGFPRASKKLSLEMQRWRVGWLLSRRNISVLGQDLQLTSACVLSQLCRRLRWRAMSAPRLEVVGTAPRGPRAAVGHHRGGCLRGGTCSAAAPGVVGRSLLQVTPSFHWRFQPLSSPFRDNPASLRGTSSTPLLHWKNWITGKANHQWCGFPCSKTLTNFPGSVSVCMHAPVSFKGLLFYNTFLCSTFFFTWLPSPALPS